MDEGFAIGLDLGGTDLKAGRVRPDGQVVDFSRRPSRAEEGPEAGLAAMAGAVADLRADGGPASIGLGCPGVIVPGSGRLLDVTAHLPGWRDTPVGAILQTVTGLPVVVDNDANLAALAEHHSGAARGTRVSITVTLGTGIGCGIVVDGHVFRGAWGGAGELGHVALGRSAAPCPCGVPDCVEPQASGSTLERASQRLGCADPSELFARALSGDAEAREVVESFADRLGATLATAIHLLNPEVVVIGGGVSRAGAPLIAAVERGLAPYLLRSHCHHLRVALAEHGERAGVIGAGLNAWLTIPA